jgi:gluconolactonase
MTLVDPRHRQLQSLVGQDAVLEELSAGFKFTEGPVWVPRGGYLLFSDVAGSARYRWDETTGITHLAEPTGHGNGMTLDADGMLVVCEHDTSTVVRIHADGTGTGREIVASHFDGRELNSPNDVVVGSDGSVYFSDPPWGRQAGAGLERDRELDFQGVFRVSPDGAVSVVGDDFETPNGLCFSPDENTLYVNDTYRDHIRALSLGSDGSVASDRVFAEAIEHGPTGAVDGMKCDRHGNVWVTGPGGIWVYADDGKHLGVLELPNRTGNFHWGGPDWSWLMIACASAVFRLRTRVSGRLEPFMLA